MTEETRWVDASIRWDDYQEEQDEDGEGSERAIDIFADPDPGQTFVFHFEVPASDDDDDKNAEESKQRTLCIELTGYKADSDEVWQSTGLTVWRAAETLGRHLARNSRSLLASSPSPQEEPAPRILELGAGLGLVGILAYRLTGSDSTVILTDGDTDALEQLRENVKKNNSSAADSRCIVQQLLWGRDTASAFFDKYGSFDVLLASDVVYVADIVPPLWETVQELLRPTGIFLFAYCSRRNVPVSIEVVLQAADKAGFSYELIEEDDGVLIYSFRWKEHGNV